MAAAHTIDQTSELEALRAEIEALKAADRTRRSGLATDRLTPANSGGVFHSVAESWSQFDQELADAGQHPHQTGEHADWIRNPDVEV